MKRVSEMTDDEVRDLCGSRDVPEDAAKDAASRVAETVRLLNYLTLPQDGTPGLNWPADVYDIVAGMRRSAEMSPQMLSQMSGWLWDQERQGRIASDSGDSFEVTLEARTALAEAETLAGLYGEALARVHNSLSSVKANILPDTPRVCPNMPSDVGECSYELVLGPERQPVDTARRQVRPVA